MSNDNDPRDDAMREIEAAIDDYACTEVEVWEDLGNNSEQDLANQRKAVEKKAAVLALIRSKLPQPDAEHERAVEAWAAKFDSAMLSLSHDWGLPDDEAHKPFGVAEKHADIRACFHGALRLMRARPATCKDGLQVEAAGPSALVRMREELLSLGRYCIEQKPNMPAIKARVERQMRRLPEIYKGEGEWVEKAHFDVTEGAYRELEQAAGELLRVAKATTGYCRKQSIDPLWAEKLSVSLVELEAAIAKAERAGIKP